jgi:hypothetical protein
MINTWFTEIIFTANERLFNDEELARIQSYYTSVPTRLKLVEELEKHEQTLMRNLHKELQRRYPDRSIYTRRFAQDLVEGLRHLARAVLADDMRLLRHRWIDHMLAVVVTTNIDPQWFADAYAVLRELLQRQLTRSVWEVLDPAWNEIIDSLTRGNLTKD